VDPQTLTAPVRPELQTSRWNLFSRIAFRFCSVYLGLFCLTTQITTGLFSGTQGTDIPDPATLWPLRTIVLWTAAHILHVRATLAFEGNSGSGDDMFGWVLAFCLLVIAVIAAGIWSVLDRRRESYVTLHKWFRLFIRICLAGQMLNYGLMKVIPAQMPYPSLIRLIERFGDFSLMGILWSSMGASQVYEIFAGCTEVLGGLLLIIPRTATFGALICLADMTQVFMLNMTYDVPVKLFSFHLILLALFLLSPDLPRLVNVFFLNRAVAPSGQGQLFATRRANRLALSAQVVFAIWLVGMNANVARQAWYIQGGGRPLSPLYGIWEVSQMSIDQQLRQPLLTDGSRWRRAVFDFPDWMAFQRMDDSFAFYNLSANMNDKTLELTKGDDKRWKATFTFQRPAQDQLILDGEMDGRRIQMLLQLTDRDKFLLVSRGFHWTQESVFNR
jgi:uncharacterized membrane protein YphA (DoxX/SURF4 family)